jgi:PAS domain S-box-containing protein
MRETDSKPIEQQSQPEQPTSPEQPSSPEHPSQPEQQAETAEAEAILGDLAALFLGAADSGAESNGAGEERVGSEVLPKPDDMYRVLVEQIPALVFIAYLDRRISEAYVSPQIESALGFSQEEWLEDPIRWYAHIHPDDKQRWSTDAAEMFLSGQPVKAAYRVLARDGRVLWFHCEVRMVRKADGRPWFLHGVGFDITELKEKEQALQERGAALQHLSSKLMRTQDDERRRIARELHDSLGQYLVAVKMILGNARQPGFFSTDAFHSEIEELVDHCISETRTLSHLLHPPILDDMGFVAAASWYVDGFGKRSGINVSLEIPEGLGRLGDAIEVALFRALQEALTNIHRHSGSTGAQIRVGKDEHKVSLEIVDQGRGMPAELLARFHKTGGETGVGLAGIRERVKELGGTLEIRSDDAGTVVSVVIPRGEQR